MDPAIFYALPSLSAIVIKLVMFWYGRNMLRAGNIWLWMFLGSLLGLNIVELFSFVVSKSELRSHAYVTLVGYYIFAIWSAILYFTLALQIAGFFSKVVKVLIVTSLFVGTIIFIVPNAALSGVEYIGYSVTRIAGPYYWVFQLIALFCLLSTSVVLIVTAKSASSWTIRRRALAVIVGSAPAVISSLVVLVLMEAGYKVNATVILSFMINILLAVLIYTEYEHRLFRFLSFVPATREFELAKYALDATYRVRGGDLSGAVNYFESALIEDALKRCEGNKSAAAEMLGISRTTLRRKLSNTG